MVATGRYELREIKLNTTVNRTSKYDTFDPSALVDIEAIDANGWHKKVKDFGEIISDPVVYLAHNGSAASVSALFIMPNNVAYYDDKFGFTTVGLAIADSSVNINMANAWDGYGIDLYLLKDNKGTLNYVNIYETYRTVLSSSIIFATTSGIDAETMFLDNIPNDQHMYVVVCAMSNIDNDILCALYEVDKQDRLAPAKLSHLVIAEYKD